ncbi:MAG: LapA family protein [Mucilaginibacter sp.]|uniref:LapA family protein n=1 Tax=Mucilaginibacter sp. TaxID=1882438 RepID=UPI0034E39CF6
MRAKTLFVVVLTVLVTVVLMQNADEVKFKVLFWEMYLPKLVIMTGVGAIGIILGFMMGSPSKSKNNNTNQSNQNNLPPYDTLSQEDRDYISD